MMYENCVMCNKITPRIWIQKTDSNGIIYTLTGFLCVKVCVGAGRQKKRKRKGKKKRKILLYVI